MTLDDFRVTVNSRINFSDVTRDEARTIIDVTTEFVAVTTGVFNGEHWAMPPPPKKKKNWRINVISKGA